MSVGTILLIAAMVIITVAFISRPFWAPQSVVQSAFSLERSSLLAEKERILTALEELDTDHDLGKVMDDVYQIQRKDLLLKGSEVLKELEAFGDAKQSILAEVKSETDSSDDPVEAMIAARKAGSKKSGKGQFCTKCGNKLLKGDAFCPSCGTKAGV